LSAASRLNAWALVAGRSFAYAPVVATRLPGDRRTGAAPVVTEAGGGQVRLSELVATLSLVSDLGMGRPMERVLRQTVIAMRLAEAACLPADVRTAGYYTSLLTWVGCAVDTTDIAALFGEEADLYADTHDGDLAGASLAMFVARHLGRGDSSMRRAELVGRFVLTAGREVQRVMQSHCLAASQLADRLSLGESVRRPLLQAFERWDGRGVPGNAGALDLAPAIRLVHLADVIEAFHQVGGPTAAVEVAAERRGTQFDPGLVDVFRAHTDDILSDLSGIGAWDEVIALDPSLGRALSAPELDVALEALADFADLKSPWRLGHSRGVARLAAGAATSLGLTRPDVALVRRAALVHDLGMIGVSSTVWDETKPWSVAQRERARTHPYLTERMLARSETLAALGRCASMHHERIDGSGYPHGLSGEAIPLTARILAAADVCHALREPRPHRQPYPPRVVDEMLRAEVRAGRLDGMAANAVLEAAGHRVRRRAGLPSGLTPREVEVLVLLARGRSNAEIAGRLTLSRKTVSAHLEHIYRRLGVSTRTEAALFAMRHGLLDLTES
jgi:HD-GYP domain-containing protein (c-di-GMP phosphodiesterase class II)